MSSPAAWHPDPTGRHDHRYWDGEQWTEHVADAGVATTDPLNDAGTATDQATGGTTDATESTEAASSGSTEPAPSDTGQAPAMPPIEPTSQSPAPPAEPAGPGSGAAFGASGAGTGTAGYAPPSGAGYGATGYGQTGSGAGGFPTASPVAATTPQGGNPMAIIGMILGIASILFSWLGVVNRGAGVVLLIAAVTAIVLSGIGKSRANKGRKGNGMAITGIVTGIIGIIAAGLFLAGGEFYRTFSDEFTSLIECLEETGDEEYCQEQFERQILER